MTDQSDPSAPTVLTGTSGRVGHLTLNRPRALNALDAGMIARLTEELDAWRDDPRIAVVLLDGPGDRGFCAGGDVRALYEQVRSGDPHAAAAFFGPEYRLNAAIAEYPKPVVAFADGITMGGGIGLAGHAGIRVVTERSRLAMPETRIGFSPDVGGTWLLARAPGRLGEYLGVTGATMDAADAIYAGFADVFVPADRLGALRDALTASPDDPYAVVGAFAADAGPSRVEAARPWIDDAFAAGTVPEIVARLRKRTEPAAAQAAGTIGELSPTGMAVTLEAVRKARELPDLRAVLAQEHGVVMWFVTGQSDLVEGIRAQLVDKDRSPRWNPPTPDAVSPEVVASAFAYRPAEPLWR